MRKNVNGVIRISLDSACLNVKHKDHILNEIEALEKQGKVELYSSLTVQREQTRPKIKSEFRIRYEKRMEETKRLSETTIFPFSLERDDLSASRFVTPESKQRIEQIMKICFPNQSWNKLRDEDKTDVRILEAHAYAGLDYFLTKNTRHFIKYGRQNKLEEMGIFVREPDEAFKEELKTRFK
jgi:hypothetical protein